MISSLNNVSLQINIEVKFKLRSLTDKQTWRGQVVSIAGYDVASAFNEILATHNNMESEIAKTEPAALTYLLIKCTDGQIRPFATNWIIESTFERTDNVNDVTMVIHNISVSEKAKLLTYIRDLGYEVTCD